MTWWEWRAHTVLLVAKLLRINLKSFHESYRYNPLVQAEVDEAFRTGQHHHYPRRVK